MWKSRRASHATREHVCDQFVDDGGQPLRRRSVDSVSFSRGFFEQPDPLGIAARELRSRGSGALATRASRRLSDHRSGLFLCLPPIGLRSA
jgi:hypothetical protein